MKHFLSPQGMQILEALSFTKTLYAFDFDGTLAKIVSGPTEARLNVQTVRLISKLSELVPVAVISGRGRSDLKDRIPPEIPYAVGNHGLEGLNLSPSRAQKTKLIAAQWKKELQSLLNHSIYEGVDVEDKTLSLALHYRKCRRKKIVKAKLLQLMDELENAPRIILGKSVINLIPKGAPHKGMALLELMQETGATRALYVGDDDTDEDVFSLPDERIFSVRVGQKKGSHAKYYLRRQTDINSLLRKIVNFQERLT
jgi:trehalose 6-phosphate phosphatase